MKDEYIAFCCCRGCEYGCAELVFIDSLRTAEGEENAAWLDLFKGFLVQACISLQRIAERIFVLGECRWIEDDEIVGCFHLVQELERVFSKCLMAIAVGEVEFHIGVGKVYCLL